MQRLVKVDGKTRVDKCYPAGFMDVVSIDKTDEHFRLIYDQKGRFVVHRITALEAQVRDRPGHSEDTLRKQLDWRGALEAGDFGAGSWPRERVCGRRQGRGFLALPSPIASAVGRDGSTSWCGGLLAA
jgi:hypothetical protein